MSTTKKEIQKAKFYIKNGYAGSGCIGEFWIDQEIPGERLTKSVTIARISHEEIIKVVREKIKKGEFEFDKKGRLYERIIFK